MTNLRETWPPYYNFDATGSSEFWIDTADLVDWSENWLWTACWKQAQLGRFEDMMAAMAMGGGESMPVLSEAEGMMAPMSMSFVFEPIAIAEPEPETVEKSTAELVTFVQGIYEIIENIDAHIEEDVKNADSLYDMKDFLEEVLLELNKEQSVEKACN